MNIWSKVITAVRSSESLAEELPLDSQAMRILDEEVRNTTKSLIQLQQSLDKMQQQQRHCEEEQQRLSQAITQYEGYAVKAIESDEALALDIAKKIAELEADRQQCQSHEQHYQNQCQQLGQVLDLTHQNLARLRQQIDMVKASENVHRAQQSVVSKHASGNGKIPTAMDALQRLKQRQSATDDNTTTVNQKTGNSNATKTKKTTTKTAVKLDDDALQQRLIEAGIINEDPDVSEIMQRIKQQAKNS